MGRGITVYETFVTVVGNVVTTPVRRDIGNGEHVVTMRIASNPRRLDYGTGEWLENGAMFVTVTCWRRLGAGVEPSLRRGDPVIAYGQLRSYEYTTRDGGSRRDLELRAYAVGPDLSRCTAQVTRRNFHDGAGADYRAGGSGVAQGESASTASPNTEPESVDTPAPVEA